jgi:hypothetical protein
VELVQLVQICLSAGKPGMLAVVVQDTSGLTFQMFKKGAVSLSPKIPQPRDVFSEFVQTMSIKLQIPMEVLRSVFL